jgi:outer membrane protein insertion porin family
MRQPEGGWISTQKVERGKVRLQRLGYFSEVNVETPAVPGTTDQVDVNYTVVEQQSGKFSAGVGYSQSSGIIFQTSITQDNFLGSGKRVSFDFNNSEINRNFGLGYTNPYWTVDGVSRGFNAFYRETNAQNANTSNYNSTAYGGGMSFGIPVSEYNFLFSSFSYENTDIDINNLANAATQLLEFCADNASISNCRFDIFRLLNRFSYDTRNKAIFPDKGVLHSIEGEVGLPFVGNSLEFYKVYYRTQWYTHFYEDYIVTLKGDVGYGDAYSDTTKLPFFENFYAGGPRSVRGYEDNTLGPLDSNDRPLGGNFKLTGGAELILPLPFFRDVKSIRISGFFDAGNVYDLSNENLDLGELRYSAGLSGIWVSPFGIVSVSVAQPFNDGPDDRLQPFQFTFGSSF